MALILALLSTALLLFFFTSSTANALSLNHYDKTCPEVESIVAKTVEKATKKDKTIPATLLRMHFHDCFIRGCDGSVLLYSKGNNKAEKDGPANLSLHGFYVIESAKKQIEAVCPGVVSCADILAIAARDSVKILGGPNWDVKLGRRDARTASQAAANNSIPPPTSNLNRLISSFNAVGLSTRDLVALSGSHTIGQARCTSFRARIYNESNIDKSFARTRQGNCPRATGSGDNNLAPLDLQTPTYFDNNYFKNLINQKGLLHSDQQLFNGGSADSIVRGYAKNPNSFTSDFAPAMIKMGDISPLTGSRGEIRKNCRTIN